MRLRYSIAMAALLLAACSSSGGSGATSPGAAASARHPVSGLPVIPLTVTHDGKVHAFRVEVAASEAEQQKGLMFRTEMGPDEGMIFPMRPARPASFWMRNTVLSLDIVFIGPDGRITNIAANAVPYSEDPLSSVGLVKGVLELNAGRTAELGMKPGDKVAW